MTDRINHRAKAEESLDNANEWAEQCEPPLPEAGELANLAYAAVHALLAIHDTLAAADRYAANEAKQREAAPDPLDEDDHRDRLTADGLRIVRNGRGHWHWHTPATSGKWCYADCTEMSLRHWGRIYGPLAFAPDAAQDATGADLSAPEGESGAAGRGEAEEAPEPLWCPKCGHHIDDHHDNDCLTRCECTALPSVIAQALIRRAVEQSGGGRD